MNWFSRMLGPGPSGAASMPAGDGPVPRAPQASFTGIGTTISTPEELEKLIRQGNVSASGQPVNDITALRVAALFACVRIRSGAVANMPLGVKRRIDERTRQDLFGNPVWHVLNRKPNVWQTPAQFKRMMEAHVLLRGQAHALKTIGVGGKLLGLTPLHPDRVKRRQRADMTLEYLYTPKTGGQVVFQQDKIFALTGLSLDGINGLSVLSCARDAIGLSLAMEQHGSTIFRNGANVSGALKMPAGQTLQPEDAARLKAQFDEYRQGGSRDGKVILLEDGLEYQQLALSAEDSQWLQSRQLSRSDIAMFFGVPPHLIGDTDKTTSWGTGLETQTQGFLTFAVEDSLTMWEEAIGLSLLDWDKDPALYARFNRNALVRADLNTRWTSYVRGLQWGVYSPNMVLAMEDENPREGGDIFYPPPNTAGGKLAGNDNVAP